jgi:hypothetical protein
MDNIKELNLLKSYLKPIEEIVIDYKNYKLSFENFNGLDKIVKIDDNFKKIKISGSHFKLFSPEYIVNTSKNIQNILEKN